ncbi:hypothetical protein MgSA37_00292 [Mucilaginibacter gotjawali]|uniref:Uncharacterized protein n=2 Tax=Mucilaginibacter gotjawali TaxID=1550579 RepID=A0A110B052_9SPHI|nr:hypothetical protein [Mucilaginibacter gotjawali]BAU52142.1 hypothetical protein MgSA37_00292 [Mucilaginibacter gotjawali]
MSIKLNFWQTILLFLPFSIGFLLIGLPYASLYGHQTIAAMANFLFLVSISMAILYQTYLVLGFNSISGIKSTIFKLNAIIPAVFMTIYLVYVGYFTFLHLTFHNPKYNTGPMRKADLTGSTLIIFLFLIHAFITFYFINNIFVANKIKTIHDADQQQKLRSDFSIPLKKLTKISIWVVGILFILSTTIDIIRYWGKV